MMSQDQIQESWPVVYQSDEFLLPSGQYFCGDLSYILNPEMRKELDELRNEKREGRFELRNGRVLICFDLLAGGSRPNQYNDISFQTQSNSVGITILQGLREQWSAPNGIFVYNGFEKKRRTIVIHETKSMMEWIDAVGSLVLYEESFACSKKNSQHVNTNDFSESIYFGDNIHIFSQKITPPFVAPQ